MTSLPCTYCGLPAKLVGGDVVYPHRPDLHTKRLWMCQPCNAYVGCHPGTVTPLGTLADAATRQARASAHGALDPLWTSGSMTRDHAYRLLSTHTGIPHIGESNIEECDRVVRFVWSLTPEIEL